MWNHGIHGIHGKRQEMLRRSSDSAKGDRWTRSRLAAEEAASVRTISSLFLSAYSECSVVPSLTSILRETRGIRGGCDTLEAPPLEALTGKGRAFQVGNPGNIQTRVVSSGPKGRSFPQPGLKALVSGSDQVQRPNGLTFLVLIERHPPANGRAFSPSISDATDVQGLQPWR